MPLDAAPVFFPASWTPWLVGLGLLILAGLIGFGLLAWLVDVLQRRAVAAEEERIRQAASAADQARRVEQLRWIEEEAPPLALTEAYSWIPEWEFEADRARMAWLGYEIAGPPEWAEDGSLIVRYTHSGLRVRPDQRVGV